MRTGRVICAAILSFGSVCALPWILKMGNDGLGFTNSIFSVFVFLGLFALFYRILAHVFTGSRGKWIFPGLFGFFFALCMVMGTCLDEKGSVPFTAFQMWAAIFMLAVSFCIAVRYFWDRLAQWEEKKGNTIFETAEEENAAGEKAHGGWLVNAGIIFLMQIPVFLAVYPGFFVYDAQDELIQVMTRNFTTHHPLVHVLFLGGIIQLVHKVTGSYNLGIACYTLIQMAVMAGIFGWCIEKLKMRGLRKGYQILITLYFGVFPVLVMFSLCSAKDGLFAGMLLIMTMQLSELVREPEFFLKKKRKIFLLFLSCLFMMLLRHNGFYAFLPSALLLFLYFICKEDKRSYWKHLLAIFGGSIALYLLIHIGLTHFLSADSSENQEILTVPISQMARAYQAKKDGMPEEEKEILYRYLSAEALEHYTPKVSDGVKIYFNNQSYAKDKKSFWSLWFRWGKENPFTYLNAWFMTSYGFWYPDTVIDVYRGNTVFTFTYEDSSYFGYEVEEPGVRESKLPWLAEFYRKLSLEIFQQKIPVVSMLFSPGFLFWVWAFCLCRWLYRGRVDKAMPYLPIVFCQLTVLLGPTYLVRYVVYLWAALPPFLAEFDNCRQL